MKKFILTVCLFAVASVSMLAIEEVTFTYSFHHNGNGHNPRSPIVEPVFYLDGHTLTAGSYTVGSTVELLDADGVVVFTSYVYVEGDTIVIPSTLSGTYTIRVTRDDIIFVGEIEL